MKKFLVSIVTMFVGTLLAYAIVNGGEMLFTNLTMPGKIDKLAGTYYCQEHMDAEKVEDLLTSNDFYPEEIALADLNSLYRSRYIEFTTDKTYSFYIDAQGYRSNVTAFFRQTFDRMYDNRDQLDGLYDADFASMSRDEFLIYYASLYGHSTVDSLIDSLADAYDYIKIGEVETGTYTIKDDKILTKVGGYGVEEGIGYKLSGKDLKLTFVDGILNFTKIN